MLGLDVADGLLALARDKALREDLRNVEFLHRDATETELPDADFDVVVCVFGVFFAPDMRAFVAEMWRLLAPGGRLVVTTWGPGVFEPANTIFWDSVLQVEPALHKTFNPWDSLTSADAVRDLLSSATDASPTVEEVSGRHRLDRPSDFWHVVMGSGYRHTVEALEPAKSSKLRTLVTERVEDGRIDELTVDVLYATASKPD